MNSLPISRCTLKCCVCTTLYYVASCIQCRHWGNNQTLGMHFLLGVGLHFWDHNIVWQRWKCGTCIRCTIVVSRYLCHFPHAHYEQEVREFVCGGEGDSESKCNLFKKQFRFYFFIFFIAWYIIIQSPYYIGN